MDASEAASFPSLPQRKKRRKHQGDAEGSADASGQQVEAEVEENNAQTAFEVDDKAGFEYLDHPADVIVHGFGTSLKSALEQVATGMYAYMTEMEYVEIDPSVTMKVSASGHDMKSLVFNFLDECLFHFSTELIICKKVHITAVDFEAFTVEATGEGEKFDLERHPQGTEIKAITYSAMNIRPENDSEDKLAHVYVVVDI